MCTKTELQYITNDIVRQTIEIFENKIHKIILYGSYARGDFDEQSDIDVMIILDCTKEEVLFYRKQLNKIASRVGLKNDIMVSILLRDKKTYYGQMNILPFYQNIEQEGIALYG